MAVASYRRVSDEKQEDGISLEMQQDEIKKYSVYRGYENVKEYSEIKSARTTKGRLKLNELLRHVKEGRIKKVVIWKLDRLSRSLRDLMNILHVLDENKCELHSTYENIDTSTPSGRMLVQTLGMIAEWESSNTSERVSKSMQLFASKGVWLSSLPFGFNRDKDRKLIINELEKSILREAIELVFEGNSFSHSQEVTSKKYGVDWGDGYLARKVREQTMIGNIYRNGIVYRDTHEGIITVEEQRKLIEILVANMVTNRDIDHNDIFRRRVSCSVCGNLAHTQVNSNDGYKTVVYSYYCGHCVRGKIKAPSVSENLLLEAFIKYMHKLDVDELEDLSVEDDRSKNIRAIENRLSSLGKARERIQRAWIKNLMTDDELTGYQKEIDVEQTDLEEELYKMDVRTTISKDDLKVIATLFNEHFEVLDKDEKRKFVQQHVKKIEYSRKLIKGYQKRYHIKVENVVFF